MSEHSCHHEKKTDEIAAEHPSEHAQHAGCHETKGRPDFLLWGSAVAVTFLYIHYLGFNETIGFAKWYEILAESVYSLVNTIWIGVLLGVFVPRQHHVDQLA